MLRYAITSRTLLATSYAGQREALREQAARLAGAGVEFLQLREKDLAARELVELARELVGILRGGDGLGVTRLLVNGRADVAAAAGADGVHLTAAEGELTAAEVRRVFARAGRPRAWVSASCHSLGEVEGAAALGDDAPDGILFGPVFEKVVPGVGGGGGTSGILEMERVGAGVGLERLRAACAAAGGVPVLALGGVTEENAEACVEAGAAGVAAIRMFV